MSSLSDALHAHDSLRLQVTLVGLGWIASGLACLVLIPDEVINRGLCHALVRRWQRLRRRLSRRSDVRIGDLPRRGWLRDQEQR